MRRGQKTSSDLGHRRTLLYCIVGVILGVAIVAGLYMAGRNAELNTGTTEQMRGDLTGRFQEPRTVAYQGRDYQYRDELITVLFMGIDRTTEQAGAVEGFRNGGQADFLLLMVIDPKNKAVTPIQIDRDTMAEITVLGVLGNVAGTRNAQICLSHGFGDGKEQSSGFTADAVSKHLFGVDIDFYVSINLDGIPELNDMLGGVTVTLEDDFSALDPTMTIGTTLTLRGKQAEYYVRNRMNIGIGTNEARMVRQRDYMTKAGALVDSKLKEDSDFVGKLFDAMNKDIVSNMSRGRMINEVYASRNYRRNETISPKGEYRDGSDGFVEFHADVSALEELVIGLFFVPVETAQ